MHFKLTNMEIKNWSHLYAYHSAQLSHTTQHIAVRITFPQATQTLKARKLK